MPIMQKRDADSQQRASIASIAIVDLFGEFNYRIAPSSGEAKDPPLVILYGDNGSGKTTILNLLVHLLSPEPYGGHRTSIGETQFREFTVTLSDNTTVSAKRKGEKLIGEYTLTIGDASGTSVEYLWTPTGRRRPDSESADEDEDRDEAYKLYCGKLVKLGVTVHFLSDSRKVSSFQRSRRKRHPPDFHEVIRLSRRGGEVFLSDDNDESWLRTAIRNAVQTVRSLALAGTNRGYESANHIYKEIVSHLVTATEPTNVNPDDLRGTLQERLQLLGERNVSYAEYGLTSSLEVNDLESLLGKAPPQTLHVLDSVLTPYLDGIQARLDALEDAQKVASGFSRLMSEFYHGKTVSLHLSDAVSIKTNRGQTLRPEDLSSGEQQLMLLMCNAITASRDSIVFAIDEPELSLNVKWQRRLVDSLIEIMSGSRCQLLLATHSIELLSKHSSYVVQLKEDDIDA